MAGPWFAVHRVGEGWKTLEKIWMSNGARSNIAVVQTRLRFADDKDIYLDDGSSTKGFDFAKELAELQCEKELQEMSRAERN